MPWYWKPGILTPQHFNPAATRYRLVFLKKPFVFEEKTRRNSQSFLNVKPKRSRPSLSSQKWWKHCDKPVVPQLATKESKSAFTQISTFSVVKAKTKLSGLIHSIPSEKRFATRAQLGLIARNWGDFHVCAGLTLHADRLFFSWSFVADGRVFLGSISWGPKRTTSW